MDYDPAKKYVKGYLRARLLNGRLRDRLVELTLEAKRYRMGDEAAREYARSRAADPLTIALLSILVNFVISLVLEWWRRRNPQEPPGLA